MMKSRVGYKSIYGCVVAVFLVGAIMFSRGTILGNIALKLSFVFSVTCIFLATNKKKICALKLNIYFVCLLFFGYCFLQGMILNDVLRYPIIVENTVYWITTCTAALLVTENKSYEKRFGKYLILIMSAFVISYIVTFVLSMIVPLQSLHITTVDYDYFYDAPVYFPFTLVYGVGEIGNLNVPRMLGFGRESGITQTFYIWGFYKCKDYFENCKWLKILLGLGVLVCFSTTGLAIFAMCFIIDYIVRHKGEKTKKKYYLLLVIATVFILLYGGTFSFAKRVEVSYQDRIENIANGFDNLKDNPVFGIGFMKSVQPSVAGGSELSDICLLASSAKIGLVGMALFLLIYIVCYCGSNDKKKFILCNSGFFITTLGAQPLYYVPLIYIMLFVDYYDNSKKLLNNRKLMIRWRN